MKIRNLMITGAVLTAVALVSCSKYSGFDKTANGLYYKFYVESKDTVKPAEGSILTMNMRYRMEIDGKDSVFFNSKDMARPFEIELKKSEFKADIYEGLGMLKKGDSATFIISAYDFFTKTARYPKMPEGIDSTTMMYFDVKLLKSQTLAERQQEEKAKAEKFKSEEPGKIDAFLKKNNITAAPSSTGVYVMTSAPGAGKNIQKTDWVKMNLTVTSAEGKKIFSSVENGKPVTFEFGQKLDTKGLDEALATMKKGSKALILVPSEMGYGEKGRKDMNGQDIIAPYSPIAYEVEILDIQSKAEHMKAQKAEDAKNQKEMADAKANETSLIQKYVSDNKITAKPNANGIYYIEKTKGNGEQAARGTKVKVLYTGKLLNGKVFDASSKHTPVKPLEFTIGNNEVIPGWEEGIAMMKAGGKATLIIPSRLGYGDRGAGQDIPPFAPLVFDVELVGVSKGK
jgi:FKBP-type peptidyl-prolyl cis-trans isomerase